MILSHPWWLVVLAAIGVIAIIAVGLSLFSNLGEGPDTATFTEVPKIGSGDFLAAVAATANAPLRSGGTARLLNNGDEIFPALYAALESARTSINFMVYIWEPGVVSDRIFDILTERARAGVDVRVMGDGLGCRPAPEDRIEALRAAGGKWCWFHPPRFGQLTYFHKRNHRRAIIVDGEIGFLGGAAVADKWLGRAQDPEHWRDAMLEVRGPLATSLQPAFIQLWSHNTGELIAGSRFLQVHQEGSESSGGSPEAVRAHVSILGSPSSDDFPLRRLFQLTIRSAERSIYITNPYFVPDVATRALLRTQAKAGIDVRVLVPSDHNDVFLIRWSSQNYYDEMLESGVRIYEYQPTMIHQKHMVVDGKWSIVGSANFDVRSDELNQESVIGMLDLEVAEAVQSAFFRDLEQAREIQLEEWRRRPRWHRVRERFFCLFEEQF